MLVVGATWPEQMSRIRAIVGDMPLLVPGVGAQGGDVEALLKAGQTANGTGLVISSSRAILYASSGADFADAARAETLKLREQINTFRRSA
jgi:orotidine-5'-phosphate decarboxylase